MANTLDFATGPAVVVFQPGGRVGGVVSEALSQEGISFLEQPIEQIAEILSRETGPRLAIVIGAPASPLARNRLRQWVDEGGSAVLLWCDQWPSPELRDWFGVEREPEDVEGGYLWPAAELAIPSLTSECLQLVGRRFLYSLRPDSPARVLGLGASHPTAAIAFDANGDGFSDDEWFWAGQDLYRYARGRTLIAPFSAPGLGRLTPSAVGSGDFTGDGLRNNLMVARNNAYAFLREGQWREGGVLPGRIRHILTWNPGSGIWPIQAFLDDGSVFVSSNDGGRTWTPLQAFAPEGQAVPTDFGYSYEYLDDGGTLRVALNLFAQGAFFSNFGAGWVTPPVLPDLGPKYLFANIIAPTVGYASDAGRTGLRNQISLLVHSNVYARDPASGGFNYPQQFHKLYQEGPAGRHPLIVNRGRATAVLYDFEQTVYQLQQGLTHDPSLAVVMARGSTTFSPIINFFDDWIDYTQLDLPQADMHERLLRVMITSVLPSPIPRLWYFPNEIRSVSNLSHDVEIADADQNAQVAAATMRIGEVSTSNRRKDTFFVLMTGSDVTTMSAADLAKLRNDGHDVTIHFDTFSSTDFTAANFRAQSELLRQRGIPRISGSRNHGLSYVKDFLGSALSSQPETIYDSTMGGGPGYSHCGSVLPYRLYSLAGPIFESFDEISHGLMDIADGEFYFSGLSPDPRVKMVLPLDDLFERARRMARRNHRDFYGCFDCLFHPVVVAGLTPPIPEFMASYAAFAEFLANEGIPTMTFVELIDWWRARRGIRVLFRTWDRRTLRFTLSGSGPIDGVTFVLPARFDGMALQSVTSAAGAPLAVHSAVLDGLDWGMVTLAQLSGSQDLAAAYG